MTGPIDESRPVLRVARCIRALALAVDEAGNWRVDLDIDEDREDHESPDDVRLAMIDATGDIFQLPVPVEVLRQLAERIEEL